MDQGQTSAEGEIVRDWYTYPPVFDRKLRRRGVDTIDAVAPAYGLKTRQRIGWILDPTSNNGHEILIRDYQVAEMDPREG